MAYCIKILESPVPVDEVVHALLKRIAESRFTQATTGSFGSAPFTQKTGKKYLSTISLTGIRLRKKKDYCGSHAGPCRNQGFERPHKHMNYLEGLDWVSFNDMVNDLLDDLGVSANVESSACIMRKGRQRRQVYDGPPGSDFYLDAPDWDYADCIGQEHLHSDCVEGTPGIRGWQVECVGEICETC